MNIFPTTDYQTLRRFSQSAGLVVFVTSLLLLVSTKSYSEIRHYKVLDSTGEPLNNAVIAISAAASRQTVTRQPTNKIMDQINRTFQPGVVSISAGDTISFPNSDNIRHHVYSFSPAKTFELKLYTGVPKIPVAFTTPGVVVLGCNIHDSMIGYIYVADSPLHGVSDEKGSVYLDTPPDTQRLSLWHPSFSLDGQKHIFFPLDSLETQQEASEPIWVIRLGRPDQ